MELYECGICSHYHPTSFTGDCRNDSMRYTHKQIEQMDDDVQIVEPV
jgi:hypothetical protein